MSFDNWNVVYSKIYKHTALMCKWTTHSKNQAKPFKSKIYQGRNNCYDRGRQPGKKAQAVETDSKNYLTDVDLSVDKISGEET